MAKSSGVWGIDIGQCALKALRCTREGDAVVADAFDYIEYAKILSQPEADAGQLVHEALEQFLSRNEIKGDKVAMSVPGQSGLAKFFKPPPVDAKKIPDIVKYEARQQIPFALEEVIWDYQQMGGGSEVDGFALETEVGLFAMKREQVHRAIQPLQDMGIELDIVQLAPLSIYNFVAYDQLTEGPAPEDFDPDNPPESMVILSMGTDTTDLVVTNGFRVWQRSIPLGGNHYTKQLTKELKLTFAKAEHLKRNARQAEDPKTIFQAMRPIFNDLVTEVQRSIGYFQGIDRKAKIGGVVVLGNAVKLPGIKQYLAKNLGYEVIDFEGFSRLEGASVVSSPAFKDNVLAFGVCYGLCLQGLGEGKLSTNLVPREILTARLIRQKKPWALASAGALLLACSFNFFFNYGTWYKVQADREVSGVSWQAAEQEVDRANSTSRDHEDRDAKKMAQLKHLTAIGEEVVGNADRRLLWLELLKAWNESLPRDPDFQPGVIKTVKERPFVERRELNLDYFESQYFPDLKVWFNAPVKTKFLQVLASTTPDEETAEGEEAAAVDPQKVTGPQGPGWVIEVHGYHYYNADLATGGATYIRNTLLQHLEHGKVRLPIGDGQFTEFTMKELGISHPILHSDVPIDRNHQVPNPLFDGPASGRGDGLAGGIAGGEFAGDADPDQLAGGAPRGAAARGDEEEEDDAELEPPFFPAPKYTFTIQFCWQETGLSARLEKKRQEQQEAQKEAQTPDGGDVAAANVQGES